MSKVVLDEPLVGTLEHADSGVELYARDGRSLGFFVPTDAYKALIYAWAGQEFRKEEEDERSRGIVRDFKEEGGLTTAALVAHLQQLEPAAKQPS